MFLDPTVSIQPDSNDSSFAASCSNCTPFVWIDSDLAPSALFRLVASARQDIPVLLALVR